MERVAFAEGLSCVNSTCSVRDLYPGGCAGS